MVKSLKKQFMKMELMRNLRVSVIFLLLCFAGTSCDKGSEGGTFGDPEGAYACQENSAYMGYREYIVEIDKVKNRTGQYIISNFHNRGDSEFVYATLKNDSVFIDHQVISGLFVDGSGRINGEFNRIELNYTTDDGNLQLQYFAVYTR